MLSPAQLTWWHLGILTKERYLALLDVYGDLDTALARINPETLQALGCRSDTIEKVLAKIEDFDAVRYEAALRKQGVDVLDLSHPDYPSRLSEIGDPPIFLSYKGDLSILSQPCLGIVGTRQMSSYGKRVTEHFVPDIVAAGMVTVSGLALGVDALVAEETVRAGGRTVAVLGHGLAIIYPQSNARLAKKILESGGLLLSEFPLELAPDKYTFPARNRIIAGLSLGTLVLEAPEESGAIITAELALEYSRDVFAVPGPIFEPTMAGCHRLIAKGHAKLVTSPAEVLSDIGIVAPSAEARVHFTPASPDEAAVYTALTTMPQPIDDIVRKCGLPTGTVAAALTMMELKGAVRNVGSGEWVRA